MKVVIYTIAIGFQPTKANKSKQKQTKADKSRQKQAKQPENQSNFEFSLIKIVQYTITLNVNTQKQTTADKSSQKQAKAT